VAMHSCSGPGCQLGPSTITLWWLALRDSWKLSEALSLAGAHSLSPKKIKNYNMVQSGPDVPDALTLK
jgi:hypothetical protein